MGKVYSFISGKGGVGKSTLCALLASALTELEHKVLIIEADSGMRGMDVLLSVENNITYDLKDALENSEKPENVAVSCPEISKNLFLIAATMDMDYKIDAKKLETLLSLARESYDFVLIDAAGGMSNITKTVSVLSDEAIIVVTPDPISVRDAETASEIVYTAGQTNQKLLINMIRLKHISDNPIINFDGIIDSVGVQLIGLVLYDMSLYTVIG